jgi:hypothetical protein
MNNIKNSIGWADYRQGTSRIKSGNYFLIYAPGHPHAKSKGHVYEHRYIMEKSLGRFLKTREQIHHIDHDGGNNNLSNLRLIDASSHMTHHLKINPEITKKGIKALNIYAAKIKKPRLNNACACGCGNMIISVDIKGRNRMFISGHNQRGRHWKKSHAKN